MREIEFRGLNTSGEWVYGSYVSYYEGHHEIHCKIDPEDDFNNHPVNGGTVGQYTGLKDCDGVKIFEGDVISDHVGVGEIVWCDINCSLKVSYRDGEKGYGKWFWDYLDREMASIEVIGNIHE